jgi:fructose-1,6-bisphosphatase I
VLNISRPQACPDLPSACAPVLEGLCRAAEALSFRIARGSLAGLLGGVVGRNADGDGQIPLDVAADDLFRGEMARCGVRWYGSEEQEEVVGLDPRGPLAVAVDPLDGSGNVETNLSVGSIFSVYPAEATGEASVLRDPREQIMAGYFIYGPRTSLLVTWGQGTREYLLDPECRAWVLVRERVEIPEAAREFAINASNYRHWTEPVRAYVDDCLAGAEGPRAADYNMRWNASLVAEAHRILARGGIYLYPEDHRPAYRNGRLRIVYECAPIAWVVEQAGGRATDGREDILDRRAEGLHARVPFVFGSREEVTRLAGYHDGPQVEVSALFGRRGLFRA